MRAFMAGALGLVAGLIAYAFIKGGLISGKLFPYGENAHDSVAATLYLPVIWAIGAGFWFEKVYERVRQTTG